MKVRWIARLGEAFAAMVAAPVARAAEWQNVEAELIAVTGSRESALDMARCAVEAAKAGVRSPEELATLLHRAHVGGAHHQRDLWSLRRRIDEMLEREFG